jgi:hypothetical protein
VNKPAYKALSEIALSRRRQDYHNGFVGEVGFSTSFTAANTASPEEIHAKTHSSFIS